MTLTINSYLSIEQPTFPIVFSVFISQYYAMIAEDISDAEKDRRVQVLKRDCIEYISERVFSYAENERELAEIAINIDVRQPLGDYVVRQNAILRTNGEDVKRMGLLLKVILYWYNLTPDQKKEEIDRFRELLNRTTLPPFMEQPARHRHRLQQEHGITPPERILPLSDIERRIANENNINQSGSSKYNSRNKKNKQKKSKKRSKKSIKNKKKSRRGSSTNKKAKKIKRKLSLSRRQRRKT